MIGANSYSFEERYDPKGDGYMQLQLPLGVVVSSWCTGLVLTIQSACVAGANSRQQGWMVITALLASVACVGLSLELVLLNSLCGYVIKKIEDP